MKTETKPNSREEELKKFSNPLIKQGNSYCVRVPSNLVKELGITEGDMLGIKLQKLDLTPKTEYLNVMLGKVRPLKELKKYSDEKLMAILLILMRQGKYTLESSEYKSLIGNTELTDTQKKQYSERVNQELNVFYAKIEKDFGKSFLEDYKYVASIVGKKGFN